MIGDLVHNLRSALDHLAIALVLSENPNADIGGTAFPLRKNDPLAANAPAAGKNSWKRMVKGMSPAHVAAIKAVQPFNNPHFSADRNTLAVLNALSNADKHRRLVPIGGSAGGVVELVPRHLNGWQLHTNAAVVAPGPFQDGAEIARFGLTALRTNPDMETDVGAKVGVGVILETDVGVPPSSIDVTRCLHSRVLDIVNSFEARFFV